MPTSTGTVVADFVDATLVGQAAAVTLTPTAFRSVEEGQISPTPLTVPMVGGVGQLVVAATTADWKYRVDEVAGSVRRSYYIDVPAGTVVQLKDVAHAVPPNPLVVPVRTINGIAPDANGNVVIGAGGEVPTSRLIVAGAGLVGGGDLTVDRALSVVYGTTADTSAQGNDARIVGAVQAGLVDAKGDLLAGGAADTIVRVAVGGNGQVLTADSSSTGGIKWATAGSSLNPAKRRGLVAANAEAFDAGPTGATVNLPSGRLIATRMLIDAADPITSCLVPLAVVGAGPGSVWLGVYEQSGNTLTRVGLTADAASQYTGGGAATWKSSALGAQVAGSTARAVWHVVLSTLTTPPAVYVTDLRLNGPLSNPLGVKVTVFKDGQASLPDTLDLTTTTEYDAELIAGLA